MTQRRLFRHHGLLGTVIELRVECLADTVARRAERLVINEIERLERVFSVFDPASELSRWKTGTTEPGDELTEVLGAALSWHERSGGAYNPEIGTISELWQQAADAGELPDPEALRAAVATIAIPGYSVGPTGVTAKRHIGGLSLNALAKGWIVERATRAALSLEGVEGAMVNAGGDLLNLGTESVCAGIEDPFRPFDNLRPAVTVQVEPGMALATSGGARRGWEIGNVWHSHVIDPRIGQPAGHVASASVLAESAADADAVATILTVLRPEEGLELAGSFDDMFCFVISNDGEHHASPDWPGGVIS